MQAIFMVQRIAALTHKLSNYVKLAQNN